jgi:hypothetical protein
VGVNVSGDRRYVHADQKTQTHEVTHNQEKAYAQTQRYQTQDYNRYKKRHFCLIWISNRSVMAEVPSLLGTEFDIFGRKPKQISTVEINETIYRPIASVDQAHIEFVIPGDSNTYVN